MPRDPIRFPYGRQSIDEADIDAVVSVLRDDWITQGPRVEAFERAVSDRVGARAGVAVSSGTAALHSACSAAGLAAGREAVVPVLTFAATAAAVRMTGAEVKFADVDPDTWSLSVADTERAITAQTRALLPVDFAGQPCDWDALTALADVKSLTTIADAAHSLGAEYQDRPVGSLADMTCFSFHPVKAITTAEGGMTTTSSEALEHALRKVRGHGIERDPSHFVGLQEEDGPLSYEIQELGLNYRISDVQCALGLSQLKKLDNFVQRRTELAGLYLETLSQVDLLRTPSVMPGRRSAWHIYVVRLCLDRLSWSRGRIFDALRGRGLGVQVHYKPLHLHPYYGKRYGVGRGDFPQAERYYDEAITLPLYPGMTDEDVLQVCQIVMDVLDACRR